MGFLALLGIGVLIAVLIVPWVAMLRAEAAQKALAQLEKEFRGAVKRLNEAVAQIALLQQKVRELQTPQQSSTQQQSAQQPSTVASPTAVAHAAKNATVEPAPAVIVSPPLVAESVKADLVKVDPDKSESIIEDEFWRAGLPAAHENATAATNTDKTAPITAPLPPTPLPPSAQRPIASAAASAASRPAPPTQKPVTRPQPPRQPVPVALPEPSDFELLLSDWVATGKEWLFGGNLVAKVGLLILFIGVAFLVRLASNYVTVPIEVRLAGVAAGAIGLLVWGWRIRESRRGIALPVQGAALAILMLVTFGAFKLYDVIPGGATFALLFVLVAFTCILAVLQDAIWLAIFGIAGGFAAPILTSTGGGSHIALFSYYCLLNAGVLAIALKRSWRALNILGFAFTFIVGAAWGEQRYVPDNYASSQAFLVVFWLFYIAIAVLFAWRRAPQLKSYVDGTLVFGVPMAGMALQYGLVKDIHFGMSISALCVALTYAFTASVLWRWRQGNLRLLVESFLALAIVFGTLAIPLAFDGRWTSAAWAVEGAAIVWVGLKQKQKLAWQFGVVVQLGSWVAFLSALTGLNPLQALEGNVGLGFLLLGVTGVLMALMFRRHGLNDLQDENIEQRDRQRFGWMASGFISVAVLWLLLGMWVEVWFRLHGAQRATLLVATALVLVYALQFLGKKAEWRLPDLLGGAVAGIAGIMFVALMVQHMDWHNFAIYREQSLGELLSNGSLLGGLMLCAGALVSAFAFKNRLTLMAASYPVNERLRATRTTTTWLLVAVFWWCGFVLHGIAHAVAYLTSARDEAVTHWYSISFWAAYSIGLSLSALLWVQLAVRNQFPHTRELLMTFWPVLTGIGGLLFWRQVDGHVWWRHDLALPVGSTINDAWLTLLSGPFIGALILCALGWYGARRIARDKLPRDIFPKAQKQTDAANIAETNRAVAAWLIGFGVVWYLLVVDAVALSVAMLLRSADATATAINNEWWQLDYAQVGLLLVVVSAIGFLHAAKRTQLVALRWLAVPAAVWQAFNSVVILGAMYLRGELPSIHAGIAMLACWLGLSWCLRYWQRNEWRTTSFGLRALHFGRVIAPWLAIAPLVSLSTWDWLVGKSDNAQSLADSGWVVAGMWPDYLAAWISIASLFVLLRQVKVSGWPLRPLQAWYGHLLIPLATLWAVLLAIYWNLRQDGNMSPLPYLPLLNPLDITTGFVALLIAMVWQANKATVVAEIRAAAIKVSMALSFGWFNLLLLRTAAQYLQLPYRFHALYASQFVQAMLSIVWTLTAFMLMRYAAKKLSKPLWMVGAALLVVVVAKLGFVDLSNSGSIARIVSFMGVGGLMLVIGYLAPLPRSESTSDAQETT